MRELLSMLAVLIASTLPLIAQFDCIKGNCNNGYGTCVFPSGSKYVGDFRNGKIHGKGIQYFSDGNKYIGHWADMQRHGEGRMVFASGDEYLGYFQKNKIHGRGKMTYASGDSYEGDWADNKPHGQGVFLYANKERYEGQFRGGVCEGRGSRYYADGSRYEGEWKDNLRHGKGTLFLADGQVLAGYWSKGEYGKKDSQRKELTAYSGDDSNLPDCNSVYCDAGRGRFTYRDGSRYVGDFQRGEPKGVGKVYYASGNRYEGGWERHAPHGQGIMYYLDGSTVSALWEYGNPIRSLPPGQQNTSGASPDADTGDLDANVKIWAVIVGAARYDHMPELNYTDDDAYQLYAFLKSPEGGALPDDQLRLLIDEQATRINILAAMRNLFLRADENDVILFYFSGHGLQGAFLPIDFDGYKNSLRHEEIKELLKTSAAKHKLVVADACHSGSLYNFKTPLQVALQKYYKAFEDARGGTALLMSSRGEEFSLEDGGLRSGIFSHFLVKGLKGQANTDQNDIITIRELYNYVHQSVRSYTGNAQTPTLTGNFDDKMPVALARW